MEVLEAARKLGAVLQQDERYIRYAKALLANEKNEELQSKVGEFNITRMNLDNEISKEDGEKSDDKIKELNDRLRSLYSEIMSSPEMVEYNDARQELDRVIGDINSIISMCVEGADPETCEPASCTGNCSSCGGCH